MPFTLIHGLLSYFLVCFFTKDKRLRFLGFAAGTLPDLDGIPILFDMELFYAIHHELFHPPIYGIILAIPVALVLGHFFKMDKVKTFAVFAASFILHPLTDVLFTNWPVKLLWPFSEEQFLYPIFIEYNAHLAAIVMLLLFVQLIKFNSEKTRQPTK